MRRLIVMRHAKSSWASAGLSDHARPLNRRGRLAAPLMGAWLREIADEQAFSLDRAIVSDSRRTRETWGWVSGVWGASAEAHFEPRLYLATTETLYSVLHELPETDSCVLFLAHNPGLCDWVASLSGRRVDRFPTAATALLSGEKPWREIGPGDMTLDALEEPKGLV